MIRTIFALAARMLVEVIVGFTVAAALLAVGLPFLIRRNLIVPGDPAGALIIMGVLVCSLGVMLFRPGSAINRYGKLDD